MTQKICRIIPVLPFVPVLLGTVWLSGGARASGSDHTPRPVPGDTIVAVREAILPAGRKAFPRELMGHGKNASTYRMIAFGGSLTAGFQNGGLFREGQQWAYPHLIARQIGVPFAQPLFSKAGGNGTGYFVSPPPTLPAARKKVTNNLAVSDTDGSLESYTGTGLNNFAVPFFSKRMDQSSHLRADALPFMSRIKTGDPNRNPLSQREWISSLDTRSDLFIFEAGFDDLVHSIQNDGGGISRIAFEALDLTDEMKMIGDLVRTGKKGLLLNVPDVLSLPYFQQYRDKIKNYPVRLLVKRSTSIEPVDFDPEADLLLPCETAEKIIARKLTGTILLKDTEVISRDPYDNEFLVADPATFNRFKIERAARLYNLAVADLHKIYRQVLEGSYTTHDGVKIDPSWPSGNFFSIDGIYPTALGQAVIANECIRALNLHYGLSVPLIATKDIKK
ncbi:MAG: hypothetical protein ABS46_12980 [Cytophagaceae bacterium SCN 52-12]|nr:MAG: hypothetical protein ABS46_12980 [Cytophagaceae bacterium SCN 52-12]